MYLTKSTYLGANYEHNDIKGEINLTKQGKKIDIKLNRVTKINEEIGYWRKANAIHQWFVDNVQEGEDNCRPHCVSKENLITLLNLCKQVKADPEKAPELLPTTSGFFFGSTEYGENYMYDINTTIEIMEAALKEDGDIEYRSSW